MIGKFVFASAAAFALVAAAPATANSSSTQSDNGGTAATSVDAGKEKGERKICRTFENTASRMKAEKVCLTREQWKKFDANQ